MKPHLEISWTLDHLGIEGFVDALGELENLVRIRTLEGKVLWADGDTIEVIFEGVFEG